MSFNHIFLSHRGLDKDIVRQYEDLLTAVGLRPWLDESELPAGTALVRALSDGMAKSCAAVFFITPQYIDDGYLRSEINDALAQQVTRGDGFVIISLLIADDKGTRGTIPEPLKKHTWKEPKTHLEGVSLILKAIPPYLRMACGYSPIQHVVPPTAKEVALVGQNLSRRMGHDAPSYQRFLGELKSILSRSALETLVLVMMTPKALLAIHPRAATQLKTVSLPRLRDLYRDLSNETRIAVAFHPSATLSVLAVDWTRPNDSFALVTPKFQTTARTDDRVTMLLDERYFDRGSLARMLEDARDGFEGACEASLKEAPSLLESLLREAEQVYAL